MTDARQPFRPTMALLPLVGLFLAGLGRLVTLQASEPQPLPERLRVDVELDAPRGPILDRDGRPLAMDRPRWTLLLSGPRHHRRHVRSLAAGTLTREEIDAEIAWLAGVAGVPARTLAEILDDERMHRVVAHGYSQAEAQRIRGALSALPFSGLVLEPRWERVHPQGRVFSHVVGYTTREEGETRAGKAGLERHADDALRGRAGSRVRLRVSGRHGVDPFLDQRPAVPGAPLRTTLDARLGAFVRAELAALTAEHETEWCLAMVMDVETGALLAMQGLPDFDPNDPGGSTTRRVDEESGEWIYEGLGFPGHWRTEPGSTFKPFVVARALESGAITPATTFSNHGGAISLDGRRTIGNARGVPNERMAPDQALVHSSNVVLVQIARAMEPDALYEVFARFGYDRPIALPNLDCAPSVRARADFHRRGAERWAVASTAMGRGIAFQPLHHLRAWAALVNGGTVLEPRLLADTPRRASPERALGPSTSARLRQWLAGVVELEHRTWLPRWDDLRWGGKSGTVEQPPDSGRYRSLFVAFAPVDRPRYVVLVVAGDPQGERYYGSQVSGPAAGRILRRALELDGLVETRLGAGTTLDSRDSAAKVRSQAR